VGPTAGMGAESLPPAGIRSPDCPAHSESLYRLRYPGMAWISAGYTMNTTLIFKCFPEIWNFTNYFIEYQLLKNDSVP
jgi:hypothetical protein